MAMKVVTIALSLCPHISWPLSCEDEYQHSSFRYSSTKIPMSTNSKVKMDPRRWYCQMEQGLSSTGVSLQVIFLGKAHLETPIAGNRGSS